MKLCVAPEEADSIKNKRPTAWSTLTATPDLWLVCVPGYASLPGRHRPDVLKEP
jgi:hypothetical protein